MSEEIVDKNTGVMMIPKQHLGFIGSHPELAQAVGELVCKRAELINAKAEVEDFIEKVNDLLRQPELFYGLIQPQEKAQLKDFLEFLVDNPEGMITMKGDQREAIKEVLSARGKTIVETEITRS